jgi:glycerol-3-phosphate cytidylyltransferase
MTRKITGYTTGVFDLFHIGHLNILRSAKDLCDELIVGVSSDELVEQYKNKKPIIPLHERIEIVRAIRYVDSVVIQTNMDKLLAWDRLHFDIIFHGDDWKDSSMYHEVERNMNAVGVKLIFLPYTNGISSTMIAQILNNSKARNAV